MARHHPDIATETTRLSREPRRRALSIRNILVAIACISATAAAADPLTISGPARVIDGDTVVVGGVHVRLKGVDAAERGTERGDDATQVMMGIVAGDLTCRLTGEKTRKREVGYCFTPHGLDINREIIEMGAALACPRYDTRYMRFEQADALAAQPRSSYCVKRF